MGGRVKTIDLNGVKCEAGAQWITGCMATNPLYDLGVLQIGLKGVQDENYAFRDCTTGKDITIEGQSKMDEFASIYEQMTVSNIGYYKENPEANDIDLRTTLERAGWSTTTSSLDKTIEWMAVDFELGEKAERCSTFLNVANEWMLIEFGDVFHYTTD